MSAEPAATMKAFGIEAVGPVDNLKELTVPKPVATGRDLVVRVKSVSVNPVCLKKRSGSAGIGGNAPTPERPLVTGYDCAGVVESVGPEVTLFKVGDEVFYAGAAQRRGTNAQFHAVDERLVGRKPKNVTFAQAAAVPLVFLTAWEGMVENMHIAPGSGAGRPILIIAGAGGVGSMATQIAKHALGLTVIATASRPASVAFCKAHGADHVIDHTKPLKPQIEALGFPGGVDFTLCCTDLDLHYDAICDASAPRASICGITLSDASKISVGKLFVKRLSLSMELMFTRPLLQTADMEEQHAILDRAAALIEGGAIVSTMTHEAPFTLEALKAAHAAQEAGSMLGKQVLTWAE